MRNVKCIKEVAYYGSIRFEADKLYRSTGKQGEVFDEEWKEHVIGVEGEEWFDEHFVYPADEEEVFEILKPFNVLPPYEKVELMRKQNDTYSQMLELIGWHMDEYANSGLVDEKTTLSSIKCVFDDFKDTLEELNKG